MAPTQTKVTWPFFRKADDMPVYAPYGRYGTTWYVPDAGARVRINRNCSIASFALGIFTPLTGILDDIFRGQRWAAIESSVMFALTLAILA